MGAELMSIYTRDLPHLQDELNHIGEWSYGPITIARAYGGCHFYLGKFCSLGQGIQAVFYGSHVLTDITSYPFAHLHGRGWPPVSCSEVHGQDIKIGSDVYIGNFATIQQGSVIGDGAVIGSYSVCKSNIPPYSIAVGNPCKVIRKRFPDEQIEKLIEMKWFDWDVEIIRKHLQVISSPRVDELYEIWKAEIK